MTMTMRAWAGLVLPGILASGAGANVLNVPQEYPTIQAGIDAADPAAPPKPVWRRNRDRLLLGFLAWVLPYA